MHKPALAFPSAHDGQMELAELHLRQAITPFIKDGTEAHGIVDAALDPVRDLKAFTTTRGSIRRAVEREYRGTIHADDVVEIIPKLIEDGKLL
jgi:hypothetical protein